MADAIYVKILSFANFGFAESHALSFALLVYASSWFKLHYPAAFLAGLLRNQPMGFYSPQSLVQRRAPARRRRTPPGPASAPRRMADLELLDEAAEPAATGPDACLPAALRAHRVGAGHAPDPTPTHRRDGRYAVRLGLDSVRGIGLEVAERIVAARGEAPFTDVTDLSRRAGLDAPPSWRRWPRPGAFDALRASTGARRSGWPAAPSGPSTWPASTPVTCTRRRCPAMSEIELTLADLWATGISPERHPVEHLRDELRRAGVRSVAELRHAEAGRRVHVARARHPPPAAGHRRWASPSSTSRTRPACST